MDEYREKFQRLLRELFQFESADLDFGIYRIMNYKRDVIEKFIEKELLDAIAAELDSGALAEQSVAAQDLKEVAEQVREVLGKDALDGDGNLADQHRNIPLGKKYLELQAKATGARTRPALEATIFNHLYTFFSRYYDAGDFMSKRRYSKKEKYAIPYNGEEICLHWANKDQYYIKTGEYFTDYRFQAPNGVAVHFKLQAADVEKDNVKGDKRLFIALTKKAAFDAKSKEIVIPFEYRPLTEQEEISYGKRNQQDLLLADALDAIPAALKKQNEALAALLAPHHEASDGGEVTFLAHHLRRYTQKNTSDFFIHKDLAGFLRRELDFYLKNEVLNVDELEAAGEARPEGWFQIMRVIKSIGHKIITFLAQIENFQKKLFEKKKFVTETNYCITVQNVPQDLYPDIAACDAQWEEWKELLHIDEEAKNLFSASAKSKKDRRTAFLKSHPTLPLDTKHFDQEFGDRLLGSLEDIDALVNGMLVQADNFHALTLLENRFREAIQCVYIDPPFNTGDDGFAYKDGYQHSTWMSFMAERVGRAVPFLRFDGTFYAHIDYNEKERLRLILDAHLCYVTEIIWRIGWLSGYKTQANKFIRNHDTIYQYGRTSSPLFIKTYIPYPKGYKRRDGSPPTAEGYPLEDTWNCSEIDKLNSIQIVSFTKEKVGDQALTQKNEDLVERMIISSSNAGDWVMDHFLGSGTTCAAAHKMGRRWIGIELGPQFDEYALPRLKRVLYGDKYGISAKYKWKGGGMFKYFRLESYDDALNNITFDEGAGQKALQFDDYLLKYMLEWETKESPTLLNVEKLLEPFSYKLTITEGQETCEKVVDIPETFNYLLGLQVRTRCVYENDGRRYLVYRGQIDHREIVVIWRETRGWDRKDYEQDKEFVLDQKLTEGADEVFVNGDSVIPGAKALDPVFKSRMFSEA